MNGERVSHWNMKPPPGDSITIVDKRPGSEGKCRRVIVRKPKFGPALQGEFLLYSQGEEDDGVLTGLVGTAKISERGISWAWGWTTEEADALVVKAALS